MTQSAPNLISRGQGKAAGRVPLAALLSLKTQTTQFDSQEGPRIRHRAVFLDGSRWVSNRR
jgi:hypothetical protein